MADDFKGDVEESIPSTQVEGALSEARDSVQATPNPPKGEDASSGQKMEGPEPKAQPSMPAPTTKEDTRPKVLILGRWREVLDSYPKSASGQLQRDQQFIEELTKQRVLELRASCELNTSPGAKPKSSDTKADVIYKRAFRNYL